MLKSKITNNYKLCVAAIVEKDGQILIGKAREPKIFLTNG